MDEYGTILDIDTSDAKEPMAVEEGEYLIRITGFNKDSNGQVIRTDVNGNKFFILSFDIPSEEASKGFSNFYGIPSDSMDLKKQNALKWQLEVLKRCFGLEALNLDAMIGREGYAILGIRESEEYGTQNTIKELIVGA